MSTPPHQVRRRPLAELSESQANTKPGIRLVPYNPPRLDRASSRQSSNASFGDSHQPSPHGRSPSPVRSRRGSENDLVSDFPLPPTTPSPGAAGLFSPNRTARSYSNSTTNTYTGLSSTASHSLLRSDISGLDDLDELEEFDDDPSYDSPSSVPAQAQLAHRHKFVAVHSDKTFSLVPLNSSSGPRPYRAPPSSTASASTRDRPSEIFSEHRPSSPATTLPEAGSSPCSTSSPANWVAAPGSFSTSPPRGRMVGGLRKVPKTPDLKRRGPAQPSLSELSPPDADPAPKTARNQGLQLVTKASVQSFQSDQTPTEAPNYHVYRQTSPESPSQASLGLSVGNSNYRVAGASSPVQSFAESNENYVVHSGPSRTSSVVSARKRTRLRPQFSQESLTVAPLKPGRKRSIERLSFLGTHSRESLRRSTSLASISSYFAQEAIHVLLTVPPPVQLKRTASNSGGPSGQPSQRMIEPGPSQPTRAVVRSSMLPYQPPWSPQLSDVSSETAAAAAAADAPVPPVSPLSAPARRSQGHVGGHIRQFPSISSSLARSHSNSSSPSHSHSRSLNDGPDATSPAFLRPGPRDANSNSPLPINYHDEDGDGLADLQALHHRPSRRRLSSFFSSSPSDRNLHSSASSRANSTSSISLPAWARLYYGSGERRLLMPSSESLYSAFRAGQPAASTSPAPQQQPSPSLTPPRPSPAPPFPEAPAESRDAMDLEIEPVPAPVRPAPVAAPESGQANALHHAYRFRQGIRKQTSSIWSPHLRYDRRASSYTIWDPPPVDWTIKNERLVRRNVQMLCFIAGFIFPFAWMVASFLPLPPCPSSQIAEAGDEEANFRRDLQRYQIRDLEETQYRSTRWWRQINRCLSVLGILVLAAAIALIVVGTQQRWGA